MKKQYKLQETEQNNYILELYHNGELIKSYNEEEGSLTKSLFDKLDSEGYTYGYSIEDLEKVWEQYSYVLNNLITKDLEEILKFDRSPIEHNIEICKNCQSYDHCVDAILHYPEWQVKCIHFGFLENQLLRK